MRIKDILFFGAMSIFAVIAFTYAITQIENPFVQAEKKIDQQRVTNLSKLKYEIEEYVRKNGKLPETLDVISPSYPDSQFSKTDPQTKQPYGYKITGPDSYELCATFTTDTQKETAMDSKNLYTYGNIGSEYKHPKGSYCFPMTIPTYVFPTPTGMYYYQVTPPISPYPTVYNTIDLMEITSAPTPSPTPTQIP